MNGMKLKDKAKAQLYKWLGVEVKVWTMPPAATGVSIAQSGERIQAIAE